MQRATEAKASPEALFVADHVALDFLNTVPMVNGALVDVFQSDRDVLAWFQRAGWPDDAEHARLRPGALLKATRELRGAIGTVVERRAAGKKVDPAELNGFLNEARSWLELEGRKDGALELTRRWKRRTAEEMLAPLAESAAELLAHGDFALVRRCESEACVLWFYDRTKSHHRRWCSMATCGNRYKVAEYRKRQAQG